MNMAFFHISSTFSFSVRKLDPTASGYSALNTINAFIGKVALLNCARPHRGYTWPNGHLNVGNMHLIRTITSHSDQQ